MNNFLEKYFSDFQDTFLAVIKDKKNKDGLLKVVRMLKKTRQKGSSIYLVGNGGSAAIAEHMAIDLTKNARLRALAISGSPMLTTFSNDYGYEKVFQKAIECLARKNDVLIAISSSGRSKNILNACKAARNKRMRVITFSGFKKDNPLKKAGDFNFWVDSRCFGYVELIHNLMIHYINDAIIGSARYMFK